LAQAFLGYIPAHSAGCPPIRPATGRISMAVQTSALNLGTPLVVSGTWRSRTLTIILTVAIASVFWVDSRYPALLKRYHAGTQVKAVGALTFGTVYPVDRSMPYLKRVWRTSINARCQPRRDDVLIPVRPGRAGVSRYAEAADEISLFEYP